MQRTKITEPTTSLFFQISLWKITFISTDSLSFSLLTIFIATFWHVTQWTPNFTSPGEKKEKEHWLDAYSVIWLLTTASYSNLFNIYTHAQTFLLALLPHRIMDTFKICPAQTKVLSATFNFSYNLCNSVFPNLLDQSEYWRNVLLNN